MWLEVSCAGLTVGVGGDGWLVPTLHPEHLRGVTLGVHQKNTQLPKGSGGACSGVLSSLQQPETCFARGLQLLALLGGAQSTSRASGPAAVRSTVAEDCPQGPCSGTSGAGVGQGQAVVGACPGAASPPVVGVQVPVAQPLLPFQRLATTSRPAVFLGLVERATQHRSAACAKGTDLDRANVSPAPKRPITTTVGPSGTCWAPQRGSLRLAAIAVAACGGGPEPWCLWRGGPPREAAWVMAAWLCCRTWGGGAAGLPAPRAVCTHIPPGSKARKKARLPSQGVPEGQHEAAAPQHPFQRGGDREASLRSRALTKPPPFPAEAELGLPLGPHPWRYRSKQACCSVRPKISGAGLVILAPVLPSSLNSLWHQNAQKCPTV